MSSCCDTSESKLSANATLVVALAGNPNSGKTTIFNALTGLRQKVANYPGVTVEKKIGRCKLPDGQWIDVIDLPGTYSLISRSPDEHVVTEVLRGLRADTRSPDIVVVVVDASNLQRNLYLVSQLIEMGKPMLVALNMMDVAERRGQSVDVAALSKQLGVPVVPIVGHKRKGISNLKSEISKAVVAPMPDWPLPVEMKSQVESLAGEIEGTGATKPQATRLAERLLIGDHSADLDSWRSHGLIQPKIAQAHSRLTQLGIDPMQADVEAHYLWIESVAHRVIRTTGILPVPDAGHGQDARGTQILNYAPAKPFSDRVDAILIHKFWGLLIFAAIMSALFVSLFWIADPLMSGMQTAVDWLGGLVTSHLPEGPIHDLWNSGLVKGVGSVVVFVPQIALLFLFLSIMEDSGYLARAAFLMDRLLSKVGLHGKSFIPLLSSFACAIPGIMAARTIENKKDRLATIFVAPFMSCSARLPVYTLLIGAFFPAFSPAARGGIMLACYGLGILAAVITAWFFKRTMLKTAPSAFILELPTYKLPQLSQIARTVWNNTSEFVKKAGTVIFFLSIILWAMTYYPRLNPTQVDAIRQQNYRRAALTAYQEAVREVRFDTDRILLPGDRPGDPPLSEDVIRRTEDAQVNDVRDSDRPRIEELLKEIIASEQLRYSIAGRFGHAIEPVIKPLGFDWKMGVGLVGAFAAREVFVSTMGIVYSVGEVEDDTASLSQQMQADRYPSGKPVWTPLVAVSLLIWFVLAMQCMSTLAIVRRETGGWKWPIGMMVYMNVLAYVVCLIVFQVGRIWFA